MREALFNHGIRSRSTSSKGTDRWRAEEKKRADAAELRTKLQLQEEELNDDDLEQAKADMLAAKAGLLEERERMREALKAKFDAYAHGKKK